MDGHRVRQIDCAQVQAGRVDIGFENLMGIDQRGVDGVWVFVEAG